MMPSAATKIPPPDRAERERALDASHSVLVKAPAGSGKTDLLTRRFLRLLSEVSEPGQIVAITFTNAAAAEMRDRILSKLEGAAAAGITEAALDPSSMDALAQRALERSHTLGWNLLDLPAQMRISTIDAFCRELALQQPLLSGLGGGLDISEQPRDLYRRAARRTLEQIDNGDPPLRAAIEALLLWRDNSWQDLEKQLVGMLEQRDRWMHGFVLDRDPDWDALRHQLERPFAREVREKLNTLSRLMDQVPGAREEILELAQFACEESGRRFHRELAELGEFPRAPFDSPEELDEARNTFVCLRKLLLTGKGSFRKQANDGNGFPKERKAERARLINLVGNLSTVPGLEAALAGASALPPARYTDDEWEIVKACFTVLRHAAGQLKVVFAEAGAADYIEVAQIAQNVLKGEDGLPNEAAFAVADGIHHLLVDEFQDTSRRQHQLLANLIAAWTERDGRTCFVVGDQMQSIYSFRGADAELFPRVEQIGLEIANDFPLALESVQLKANFRTAAPLVDRLNQTFSEIFAVDDGSGVSFEKAEPARDETAKTGPHLVVETEPRMQLHLEFVPNGRQGYSRVDRRAEIIAQREAGRQKQIEQVVALIRDHMPEMAQVRAENERNERGKNARKKYRIAVLGRARKALAAIAQALREAAIPFRAVELEKLMQRPEIIDALSLARALLNPQDRVAWLSVLRAPWSGLSLEDLHALVSADNGELLTRPVPELLAERANLLSAEGRDAVVRVMDAMNSADSLRSSQPAAALGTWIEQVWLRLGGAQCVDAAEFTNLDLLWKSLDSLPQGEPDLLGPALEAALGKLSAQPDPAAKSDCGVQLMTIHKSKGLEFEVVIVPDLQAVPDRSKGEMLSWLERGLPPEIAEDGSGEITEFLIAPIQSKGADRGDAKRWVDEVRRKRESQETRRLLYVACTRAREELHLFARPEYKTAKGSSLSLAEQKSSLLATAWPAFKSEIRERFEAWRAAAAAQENESAIVESIAASDAGDLLVTPLQAKPNLLHRLPTGFRVAQGEPSGAGQNAPLVGAGRLYERHEGGLVSRARGNAVHMLLEYLARVFTTQPISSAKSALTRFEPRIVAAIRASGLAPREAARIADEAVQIALRAAQDPVGQWILAPHAEAASEVRWTGVISGALRTVQVDRVFRAGAAPQSNGTRSEERTTWWIIDYKTAHGDGLDSAASLSELRRSFAPQVEAYAAVLRNLQGMDAKLHGGLYYPRMSRLDWWEI